MYRNRVLNSQLRVHFLIEGAGALNRLLRFIDEVNSVRFLTLLCCLLTSQSVHALSTTALKNDFLLFDCTVYKDKPSLSKFGIKPIRIIYAEEMYGLNFDLFRKKFKLGEKPRISPSHSMLAELGEKYLNDELIVLDYEGLRSYNVPRQRLIKDIADYVDIVNGFKARRSSASGRIGFYGAPPIADWGRVLRGQAAFSLRQDNDLLKTLVDSVDVLFPSLYTRDSDIETWLKIAAGTISEAKRIGQGKPIYAFIWPRYHEMNKALAGQLIPSDIWDRQLEFLYKNVDGVVIWDGRKDKWDEQWPWWQSTLKFLKSIGKF